jgi:MoxR-like ATPase
MGDFPVPKYGDVWAEEDKAYIPSKVKFNTFVVPKEQLEMEMLALRNNLKVLVVGPSGSGKTTLQEYIAAHINQPYLRINGRGDMESDSLLGKPWVSGGSMTYEMGELPKAMKAGWFVAFDEPWKTPSSIQMALQRMYEKDGILQLDDMPGSLADKQVVPDSRFRIVLADNVVGTGDNLDKYGATMIQDGSTLNRMDVVIKLGYLSSTEEVEMVCGMHPWINEMEARRMVQMFALLRKGYETGELSVAASPRNLYAWGAMAKSLGSMTKGFVATMLNRYAAEDEREAVHLHYSNVFGERL